ncbi:MAG: tRNA (guanosine(46)-N7)-methyltransferase TrmB [Rectinema sp.]
MPRAESSIYSQEVVGSPAKTQEAKAEVRQKEGDGILDGSIRTFVLRSGRITEAQRRAIERFGPKYLVPFTGAPLDLNALFLEKKHIVVEIGFGMGQATWKIAQTRAQFNYLGIEVHTPGVGRLISDLESHGLENVRIIQHDAVEVLKTMLPAESIAGIHIFYPDPWPKKRHHKRRLMQEAIVALMAAKLEVGGYLYFVTDIEEYASYAKASLDSCGALKNQYEDYAPHQAWRPETKFEHFAKGSGRGIFELLYIKR